MVREVLIDSDLADDAVAVAEANGLGLDTYIMKLIDEDLDRIERTVAAHGEIVMEDSDDGE